MFVQVTAKNVGGVFLRHSVEVKKKKDRTDAKYKAFHYGRTT